MSTLLDRIKADSLEARKARSLVAGPLTALLGEIGTKEKTFSPARPITEAEVIAIVRKFLNGVEESLAAMKDLGGERIESERTKLLAEKAKFESYLPTQMTEEAIRAVAEARKAAGDGMGQIMAYLKANHAGQYDGGLASKVVKAVLA